MLLHKRPYVNVMQLHIRQQAMASDGDGGIPAWLSLDVVSGLSVNDSDIHLYEEDYVQLYRVDDYEDAEVSINAVSVSGGAGIISFR